MEITEPAPKPHVLDLDRLPFAMNRNIIDLLKHTHQEIFRCLLESQNRRRLEPVILLVEAVNYFAQQTLKRQLANK